MTDGYTTNRLEVNDEGLPPLHNLTRRVRLVSAQWVNKPAAVRILSVNAYTYAAVGHGIGRRRGELCEIASEPISSKPDRCGNYASTRRFAMVRRHGIHHN